MWKNKRSKRSVTILVLSLSLAVLLIVSCSTAQVSASDDPQRSGPYFDISIDTEPDRVWPLQQRRQPDTASLNLSFEATGEKALKFDPQDTILVVDFSQGSATWDPDHKRIEATQAYVDNMIPPDRAGAVKLASNATLEHELSEDYESVKESLEMAQEPGGRTNYEEAVYKAGEELIERGDPEKQRLQIFLSDGYPTYNVTEETMELLREHNVSMATIGIGDDVNDSLLRWMANTTGGEYHYVEEADELVETYLNISDQFYTDATGKKIDVRAEFQEHIQVDMDSFSLTPNNITEEGGKVWVEWDLNGTMRLGDTWGVSFEISTTKRGYQSVFTESSGIYYIKPWNDENNFTSFPDHSIYGIIQAAAPPPPPPPPPAAPPPPPPPEIFPMPSPPLGTPSLIPQATVQPVAQTAGYQALFAPFIGLGVGEAMKGKVDMEQKEGIGMRAGKEPGGEEKEESESRLGYTLNER
ncbi:MAG: VWA domain-containing protein [Candidatus Natronoplasma sp.]